MIKKLAYLSFAALLCAVLLTGGVFAVFQYSRLPASAISCFISSSVDAFAYGDYPAGFDDDHKTVIDIAVSSDSGGLNGDDVYTGFKFAITYIWVGNRGTYGYVGSMDKNVGSRFGTPENVAFVMTLPQNDPEQKETIYIYTVKISQYDLNEKQIGDTLDNVFRVKLVKNSDGKYEQVECLKGSSPVVYYEYNQYKYQCDLKSFAVFEGKTVWYEN